MVLTVWMYPTLLHLGSMCIQATCIPFWRHDASLKTVENLIKKNFSKNSRWPPLLFSSWCATTDFTGSTGYG